MSSVTVPGTGGSIITITTNGTATHLIAQQIANALAAQGCSMLSTEAPVGQGIEPSEGGGVSILTEGAGSVTA